MDDNFYLPQCHYVFDNECHNVLFLLLVFYLQRIEKINLMFN